MITLSWPLLLFIAAITVWLIRKPRPIPPGPPAYPVIGSILSFPVKQRAAKLHELSKKYGDVMSFNILGQKVIVLSSEVAANELLHKRSAIYSDRPRLPTFELLGQHDVLSFLPYGPAFHRQRKLLNDPLTRSRCTEFHDVQIEHSHEFIRQLLTQPDRYVSLVRRFVASVLLDITYGHKVESSEDGYLRYAEQADEDVQAAARGALIDLFPVLKHLPPWSPGAWFIRYVRDTGDERARSKSVPFGQARSEIAAGTARPSFVSRHLEEMARNGTDTPENLDALSQGSRHLWLAGTDTTWSAIYTFILAMLVYPEVQRKAQKEIDAVVGSGRLPDFSDQESLPYVNCVLQECKRWNPNVLLGIPHRVMEDDVYRNMFIPKGSTIIVNARALTLDPNVYHDPHEFRPERFLPETGEPFPNAFFGYGRRICVGRYLAEANIWIAAVSMLAVFDIVKAKDEFGREIEPKVEMMEAVISHPVPFKCEFRPRNSQVQKLVGSA